MRELDSSRYPTSPPVTGWEMRQGCETFARRYKPYLFYNTLHKMALLLIVTEQILQSLVCHVICLRGVTRRQTIGLSLRILPGMEALKPVFDLVRCDFTTESGSHYTQH